MRIFVISGAVLLALVFYASAAPTEDCDSAAPSVPIDTPAPADPIVHYRKETTDQVSRNSSIADKQTTTKTKEKVKIKKLKNGMTMETIVDTSKTKTKSKEYTDEYSQSNHTLTEDGLEDSTSLTQDKHHMVSETDVIKKKEKEVIIRDKYGNIVSDTKKVKEKEKVKKKEKDSQTSTLVHTVKHVPPPADLPSCDGDAPHTDVPAPAPSDC